MPDERGVVLDRQQVVCRPERKPMVLVWRKAKERQSGNNAIVEQQRSCQQERLRKSLDAQGSKQVLVRQIVMDLARIEPAEQRHDGSDLPFQDLAVAGRSA